MPYSSAGFKQDAKIPALFNCMVFSYSRLFFFFSKSIKNNPSPLQVPSLMVAEKYISHSQDCVYIHEHIGIHMYMCGVCMYVQVLVYRHTCIHVECMCVHVSLYMHMWCAMCTQVHICIQVHACLFVPVCMCYVHLYRDQRINLRYPPQMPHVIFIWDSVSHWPELDQLD